ncbi:unnamed protein product, partial [Musa acuminata subsp. burmannicoides]
GQEQIVVAVAIAVAVRAQAFPSFSLSPPTVGRSAKTTTVRKMRICREASQECGCSGVGRWPKTRVKLRFSQRRWSLAKGKSEASLFSLL